MHIFFFWKNPHANEHREGCSISLFITEIKTIVRSYFTSTGTTKIKMSASSKPGENVQKAESSYICRWDMPTNATALEYCVTSSWLRHGHCIAQKCCSRVYTGQEWKHVLTNASAWILTAGLFTMAKSRSNSSVHQLMNRKTKCSISYNRILFNNKKNEVLMCAST